MIFVPLSLFASILLLIVLVWFGRTQSLANQAHKLFFAVIALYALQSFFISLRWGFDLALAGTCAALFAPVLPVMAYLSYAALRTKLGPTNLWPLALIPVIWAVYFFAPNTADPLITLAYIGFGALLLLRAWKGPNDLVLSPLGNAKSITIAMIITGATLIASGLTDIYIVFDFIQNDGRNVGFVISVVQTVFVLAIGTCAAFGRVSSQVEDPQPQHTKISNEQDQDIIKRLEVLFQTDHLHRNEDLSLRRLSRRLSIPDRKVSNAINRTTGQSVSQYVNTFRINDACELLETTQDNVLSISLAVGFATKSNFNREFIRVTGLPPTQWRKSRAMA